MVDDATHYKLDATFIGHIAERTRVFIRTIGLLTISHDPIKLRLPLNQC